MNGFTVKDAYPLSLVDWTLGRLPNAEYITSSDMKDDFWQISLDENSKNKTTFTRSGRLLYQFMTLPVVLHDAPQTMCRLIDKVIPPHLRHQVFVYVDELLITCKTFDEHLQTLSVIALYIRKPNLIIIVENSKLLQKQVKYLREIRGRDNIQTGPYKVRAVRDYPFPKSVHQ